jgi:hypothetical protein
VAPLQPEALEVGADGLGDPQPVKGQQADQRVIPAAGQPRSHQLGADLVAVQAGGVGTRSPGAGDAQAPPVRPR